MYTRFNKNTMKKHIIKHSFSECQTNTSAYLKLQALRSHVPLGIHQYAWLSYVSCKYKDAKYHL